jgi:ABC-type amino acid transport substrate-binding protein
MASAFTSAQLERARVETADGLSGRRVAAVAGSTSVPFARRQRAKVLEERDLTSCVMLLSSGDVDAVVYDRPMLEHYLSQHAELDAVLSARSYLRQGYGFASRPGSGLDDRINLALLRVDGAGALDGVVSRWLGSD